MYLCFGGSVANANCTYILYIERRPFNFIFIQPQLQLQPHFNFEVEVRLKLKLKKKWSWSFNFSINYGRSNLTEISTNICGQTLAYFFEKYLCCGSGQNKVSNRQISVRGVQKHHCQSQIVGSNVLTTHTNFQLHFIHFNFEVENFNFKVEISTSSWLQLQLWGWSWGWSWSW